MHSLINSQKILSASVRLRLLRTIRNQFILDWTGVHGVPHWARVRYHGLRLSQESGADPLVVELFAFLHDSRRHDENIDHLHGHRAAEYAMSLQGHVFDLTQKQLALLYTAIDKHSDGLVHSDATIQTCWDADRLDLGRVGIYPSAQYLSFAATKYTHEAFEWSRGNAKVSLRAL